MRDYITKELDEEALIGPFTTPPFEWVHYSPLMTRPKSSIDHSQRRVIVDLSFPQGQDINSGITKNVYRGQVHTHRLPTTDDLVSIVREVDYDAFLYSIDIARAYRNFHSDPLDWPLMGISFAGDLLIDTTLPFGARNSSFYMQKIAEFVACALTRRGACVLIYLDDLVGVAKTLDVATLHFNTACELLEDLGLPLARNKLATPSPSIKWLGIKCHLPTRTLSIPEHKIEEMLNTIHQLSQRSAMSRKEVQQLAGKINFISRVCRPAHLFMSRILSYLRAHPSGYTKVSKGARADMKWFLTFLPTYNGISLIPDADPSMLIEADSCMVGGGAVADRLAYIVKYPDHLTQDHHISQLEAINCMVAIRSMVGKQHRGKLIQVHCDNSAAVSIYHTGKGRDPVILACARAIWAHAAHLDCSLAFMHIPGELMVVADALSRAPLSAAHKARADRIVHDMSLTLLEIDHDAYDYFNFL